MCFMSELEQKIRNVIAEKLSVDVAKVVDNAKFIEDLGADSLDNVELLMELEDQFGIEISDADAEKILTVKDAIDFITSKKN